MSNNGQSNKKLSWTDFFIISKRLIWLNHKPDEGDSVVYEEGKWVCKPAYPSTPEPEPLQTQTNTLDIDVAHGATAFAKSRNSSESKIKNEGDSITVSHSYKALPSGVLVYRWMGSSWLPVINAQFECTDSSITFKNYTKMVGERKSKIMITFGRSV